MKTFLKSSEEFFLFMRIATKIGRKYSEPFDKFVVLIMTKYATAIHVVNCTKVPWVSDYERF